MHCTRSHSIQSFLQSGQVVQPMVQRLLLPNVTCPSLSRSMAASQAEEKASVIVLHSEQLGPIEALSVKTFEPFTKSQVLLVEIRAADRAVGLPKTAILKVFDPKYLSDRHNGRRAPEWTAKAEMNAMKQRAGGAYADWDEYFMYQDDFDAGTEQAQAMWEEHFYRLMLECYESEKHSYEALETMQGRHIPRLYAYGNLQSGPARALDPPFVLIEYISNGVKLSDIKGTLSTDSQRMAADLCSAVDRFGSLGVVHTDINRQNILICPDRVVLIDFGCAGVCSRFDYGDMTEEQKQERWNLTVTQNNDSHWIRYELGIPR